MRILVDMDGTIANLESEFLRLWRINNPDKPLVPLEQRVTFYIKDQYPKELLNYVNEILQSPGFFRNLPPLPGSIDALLEMAKLDIEVFICTSPLIENKNCVSEKYEWIESYLGAEWKKRVIISKDKTLIRGDYLIDDKPSVEGKDTPVWEHILFDQPYNRNITSLKRLVWCEWKTQLLLNDC